MHHRKRPAGTHKQRTSRTFRMSMGLASAALLLLGRSSQAQLTLTHHAQKIGFRLTTFATGFPTTRSNNGYAGPLGIVFPQAGGVLVSDYPGNVRLFLTDTDGQDANAASIGQTYGEGNAIGLATLEGTIYKTAYNPSSLSLINPDGAFLQDSGVTGLSGPNAIQPDPYHNKLFISNSLTHQILLVDPVAQTYTVFANANSDGLALSGDGSTLYAAIYNDHVAGFRVSDGMEVFDSGHINGADGIGLGTGKLTGKAFVNTNFGEVWEVDLTTGGATLIANGGSRGDFVSVDPTNGTLMLTQTDRVVRLTAPRGSSFSPRLKSLMIAPSKVHGGQPAVGTVTLDSPAAFDVFVSLSSSDPAVASVPANILVSAGTTQGAFTIQTSSVSTSTTVKITASAGGKSRHAMLKVIP